MFVDGFRASRLREARAAREMGILSEIPRYSLEILFVIAIVGISLYLFAQDTPGAAFTVLGVFAGAALRALPTLTRVSTTLGHDQVRGRRPEHRARDRRRARSRAARTTKPVAPMRCRTPATSPSTTSASAIRMPQKTSSPTCRW